jgi:putative Holliday junction resolvase
MHDYVVLGFDYGAKRIGVAVGQTLTCTATPVAVAAVRRNSPDWLVIDRVCREYEPDAFIVGMPRHADGSDHSLAPRIRGFATALGTRYGLPVHFVDERLSSHAARERTTDVAAIDAVAAQVIVETWLGEQRPSAPASARDGA